jgi:hypothetical protein
MLANDLADMYVSYNEGESFSDVALPIERWLRRLGWEGSVHKGPPPPVTLPPLGEEHYYPLIVDPLPPSPMLADAVREAYGQGRKVRLPYYEASLGLWRLSGTERDFPQRGMTLHRLTDTSVRMAGSYFALIPWQMQNPTSLYFGSPKEFLELIRMQNMVDRGATLICERIEVGRKEGYAKGGALLGPLPVESAPLNSVILATDGMEGVTRVVPGAFTDARTARIALEASNETAIVLFARIAERMSMA